MACSSISCTLSPLSKSRANTWQLLKRASMRRGRFHWGHSWKTKGDQVWPRDTKRARDFGVTCSILAPRRAPMTRTSVRGLPNLSTWSRYWSFGEGLWSHCSKSSEIRAEKVMGGVGRRRMDPHHIFCRLRANCDNVAGGGLGFLFFSSIGSTRIKSFGTVLFKYIFNTVCVPLSA